MARTRTAASDRWAAIVEIGRILGHWLNGAPVQAPCDLPWELLVEQASNQLVTPALSVALSESDIPGEVRDYLEAIQELNLVHNEQALDCLDMTCRALNSAGIEPVLLKGVASVAEQLYPHPAARLLGDLDILVPEAEIENARTALVTAGFGRNASADTWQHLGALIDPDRHLIVEVHRTVVSPPAFPGLLDAAAIIARSTGHDFRGHRVRLLAPSDRIVHNIAHAQLNDKGALHRHLALRQRLELAALMLRDAASVDWQDLLRRFRAVDEEDAAADAIAAASALFGVPLPAEVSSSPSAALAALASEARYSAQWRVLRDLARETRQQPLKAAARAVSPAFWLRFSGYLREAH